LNPSPLLLTIIGGSITSDDAGDLAPGRAPRTAQALRRHGSRPVTLANRGGSGTGSASGAVRIGLHASAELRGLPPTATEPPSPTSGVLPPSLRAGRSWWTITACQRWSSVLGFRTGSTGDRTPGSGASRQGTPFTPTPSVIRSSQLAAGRKTAEAGGRLTWSESSPPGGSRPIGDPATPDGRVSELPRGPSAVVSWKIRPSRSSGGEVLLPVVPPRRGVSGSHLRGDRSGHRLLRHKGSGTPHLGRGQTKRGDLRFRRPVRQPPIPRSVARLPGHRGTPPGGRGRPSGPELGGQWESAFSGLRKSDNRLRSFVFQAASSNHPRVGTHARLADELVDFLRQEI
jgi:hypothetical protein